MAEETKLRKELLKLSKIQLAKRCKKSRLATNGTKSDMVYRLLTKYKSSAVSKKKLILLQKKHSNSSPKKSSKTHVNQQKRRQRKPTDDGEIFGDELILNSMKINTHCNYPLLTIQNIETPSQSDDYYIQRLISHDSLSSLDDDGCEQIEKSKLSMLEQIKLSTRRMSELDELNDEQMLSMVKNGCTPRIFHRYKKLKGAHLSKYTNKTYTFDEEDEFDEEKSDFIELTNNPDYEQQILTYGYLRAIELEYKDIILNKMMKDLILLYCTVYIIFGIGENLNYSFGLGHDSIVVNFERLYDLERLTPHYKNIHCNATNLMIHNIYNELFATGCAWNAQLGIDEICLTRLTNIFVPTNDKIKLISNGKCNIYHTFIYTVNNKILYASGLNRKGQFGNGMKIMDSNDDKERETMVEIAIFNIFNSSILSIECGRSHSLFLTKNGNVWCCGNNYFGQCGLSNEEITFVLEPKLLNVSNKIIKICCGRSHNLLIDSEHNLISFGNNRFGQVAINNCNGENLVICTAKVNEYFFKNNIFIYEIQCGEVHSLVIDGDGNGYTFGINNYGQIGNGFLDEYIGGCDSYFGVWNPFKLISDYIDKNIYFIDIACGNHHNVLLSDKHQIIVFGDNGCCQCGYKLEMAPVLKNPCELDKTTSFPNLRKDAFVEKVLALQNETIIIFNPNKTV